MELDPVYVLAPRRRITTRRAFLFAGAAGCLGFAGGFGAGWLAKGLDVPTPASTIDPRLARALDLASPATPIDVLLENQLFLIGMLHEEEIAGRTHASIWEAVRRVAKEVVTTPSLSDRRLRARTILDLLSRRQPASVDFTDLLPDLEALVRR
jgi:hypothetical protein